MPHIVPSACNEGRPCDIAKVVLMPGDPLRAKYLAERYLEDAVCFNRVRNMLGFTGTYKGKRISVMGSGMGIPSMGLYAYELYHYFGVESILRIGTTGAVGEGVRMRDLILAMSASTDSNFAEQYEFPGTLAPTADYGLLSLAVRAAEARGAAVRPGPVFSSDKFYSARKDVNQRYRDMGMLAVEMETAGLYLTAQAAHKRALSILTVTDLLFTGEQLSTEERETSLHEMMEVALETAWASI